MYKKMKMINRMTKALKEPGRIYYKILWLLYKRRVNQLFKRHFINNPDKKSAVILASYPKSGNTFFRFVWLNIISLLEMDGKEIDFQILDNYMPYEGFFMDLVQPWKFRSLPCLLKTHEKYSQKYASFRIIHLFRNPLDTMISNYFYYSRRKGVPKSNFSWLEYKILNSPYNRFTGSFHEFLNEYFDDYCRHFKSYIDTEAIPISYEILMSEKATEVLKNLFNRLGVKIDDDIIIAEALKRSNPKRLKGKPHSNKMAILDGMHFIREGSVRQWENFYNKRDMEFVHEKMRYYGLQIDNLPKKYKYYVKHWPV